MSNSNANSEQKIIGKDLDKIEIRLIISGTIKLTSQLHIGMGDNYSQYSPESGILLAKLGEDGEISVPYIPNTSLKGILRSEAERIAYAFSKTDPYANYLCNGFPDQMCDVEGGDKGDEPCAICRIFGTNGLGAHFIISDALPTQETIETYDTKLKPGIAINRKRQVTRDKSLFFIETLQPGAEFDFQMIINNISRELKPIEFKILRALFSMVQKELLSIGGKRSTGMGTFHLKKTTVKKLSKREDFLFPEQVDGESIESFFNL